MRIRDCLTVLNKETPVLAINKFFEHMSDFYPIQAFQNHKSANCTGYQQEVERSCPEHGSFSSTLQSQTPRNMHTYPPIPFRIQGFPPLAVVQE